MTDEQDRTERALAHHRVQREGHAAELRGRAAKKRAEASGAQASAHAIGEHIPPGQPVLVGHHSERRHRRDLARMDGAMRRAVEASKEAEQLEARAESVLARDRIASDEPGAVLLLRAKLAEAEAKHARLKGMVAAARRELRGATTEAEQLAAYVRAGFDRQSAEVHVSMRAVPAYLVTNATAEVRRLRKRLAEVAAQPSRCPSCGGTLFELSGTGCNDPECRH